MGMRVFLATVFVALSAGFRAAAQVATYPYVEKFDSVTPPALPPGWLSSQNRTPGTNDFTTTTSTVLSAPNAVLSTNATVSQELVSPLFDFSAFYPDSIRFSTRRSGTHLARVLLEASTDGGSTYALLIGDTLRSTGSTNYVASMFPLPAVLGGNNAVRFRWRILADGSGTTATFRIDDLAITAKAAHDLMLQSARFIPEFPVEGDSILAVLIVRNAGRETAPLFATMLFHDMNGDSIPQPGELIDSLASEAPLAPGDSHQVLIPMSMFGAGLLHVIARVHYPPDMNPGNNTLFVPLTVGYRRASVVVNEIMYAPGGSEPEWVELYNTREDSINLKNWLVSDNIVTTRRVITTGDIKIPPGGYVVLTRDSTGLVDVHPDIPSRVIMVPNFPTLNNTGDAVVIYDNRNVTMDSTAYLPSWGGNTGGRSLERREPLGSSTLAENWGTSRTSSTPGRRNSLTRKDYDISLDTVLIVPPAPIVGDSLLLLSYVRNIGREASSSALLSLYLDANADSLPQASELLLSGPVPSLGPLDSMVVESTLSPLPPGSHLIIAAITMAGDEDTLNNILRLRVLVGHPPGALRINEIMYAPPAGMPEWVECVNISADTISIGGWRIGNRNSTSRYILTNATVRIAPESMFVVTKDTALLRSAYPEIPGLVIQTSALPTFLWNNNGDAVVLLDNRSIVMDSVHYGISWGGTLGFSLERIDPQGPSEDSLNWASSIDTLMATPGKRNSQIIVDHDLRITGVTSLPTPPGSDAGITVTVQNAGRNTGGSFTVVLYHDINGDSLGTLDERVAHIQHASPLVRRETTTVTVRWERPPPGKHRCIIVVEYPPDERPGNNIRHDTVTVAFAPGSVRINEIMYAPLSGQAEFVELVNVGGSTIDLAGWRISDLPTSSGSVVQVSLGSTVRILPPGEFLVVAADSSILTMFPGLAGLPPSQVHIANRSSGLGLNNDGDAVILRDLTGTVMDSVHYHPSWHNPGVTDRTGRSLERINPRLASNDARNWTTCTRPAGGTPGEVNSVFTQFLPSNATLRFSPNPFSPDGDGHEDVTIIYYSLPLQVSMVRVRIYDVRGRLIRHLANNEPGGPSGQVVWDGLDDEGQKARIGMYVVLLEAMNEQEGVVTTGKGVVVLAARL